MSKLKRFLMIAVSVAICFTLQTLIIPRVPYLIAVPNLMLVVVMSIGFLFGKGYGLFAGLVSGLLLDTLGSGTPGFYILLLSWAGYANGMLSEKMEFELIYVLFGLLAANELVYHLYQFGLAFLLRKHFSFLPYVKEVFIPEILLTMICFLPVYGIMIFFTKRWELRVNKGEVKVV